MTEFSLTPEEIASFEENGFIGPFDLYDPAEARGLCTEYLLLGTAPGFVSALTLTRR